MAPFQPPNVRQWLGLLTLALGLCVTSCRRQGPAVGDGQSGDATGARPTFIVEVVHEGLDLPASLQFAPDGKLVILDRGFTGGGTTFDPTVSLFDLGRRQLQTLDGGIHATSHFDDMSGNQGGAVGMVLDPDYASNGMLYVCYHYRAPNGRLQNRVSRFETRDGHLAHETAILDRLPGDEVHNGCRVAFDGKGFLYVTTGSMEPFDDALNLSRLGGKILRVTREGRVPADNPFPGSPVWSYGHRNPQGLAFDPDTGTLWSTEHGESSADELNKIERGANYGWPACRGSAAIGESFAVESYWADRLHIQDGRAICRLSEPHASRYRPAFRTYFPDSTLGISDLVVYHGGAFPAWRGNLLIVSLKAQRLFRVVLKNDAFVTDEILIDGGYGRLRDVAVGPDGYVYIVTNEPGGENRQTLWRGHSRLLRLRPAA